jgi:hypothetical protein
MIISLTLLIDQYRADMHSSASEPGARPLV